MFAVRDVGMASTATKDAGHEYSCCIKCGASRRLVAGLRRLRQRPRERGAAAPEDYLFVTDPFTAEAGGAGAQEHVVPPQRGGARLSRASLREREGVQAPRHEAEPRVSLDLQRQEVSGWSAAVSSPCFSRRSGAVSDAAAGWTFLAAVGVCTSWALTRMRSDQRSKHSQLWTLRIS